MKGIHARPIVVWRPALVLIKLAAETVGRGISHQLYRRFKGNKKNLQA